MLFKPHLTLPNLTYFFLLQTIQNQERKERKCCSNLTSKIDVLKERKSLGRADQLNQPKQLTVILAFNPYYLACFNPYYVTCF
jgi:hypothetical protein